jgi:hypothetical protein
MTPLLLALAIAAPAPKVAGPPTPAVTAIIGGVDRKLEGSRATLWQGLATALVGSSSIVREMPDADWEAAAKGDQIRVRFPRPHAIRASTEESKDRAY